MKEQTEGLEKGEVTWRVLREEVRLIAHDAIRYRLLEARPQFSAQIKFKQELCLLPLGERFSDAALIFEMLVCGLVTPCSAPYVLEDLCN